MNQVINLSNINNKSLLSSEQAVKTASENKSDSYLGGELYQKTLEVLANNNPQKITFTIKEAADQLKLYSLSEAASAFCIGRSTLRKLLLSGKIGYILVGKSKRISHQELIRFQIENTIRESPDPFSDLRPKNETSEFFSKNNKQKKSFNDKELLQEIIRNDNNGNSKKSRGDASYTMV